MKETDIDPETGEVNGISAIELLIESQNHKIESLKVNIRSLGVRAESVIRGLENEKTLIEANIANEKRTLQNLEVDLEKEKARIEMIEVKKRFKEYGVEFDKITQWTRKKIRIPRSREEIQELNKKIVENLDKIDCLESQKAGLSKQIKSIQDENDDLNRKNAIEDTTSEPECLRVEIGGTVIYLSKETGYPIENIISDGSPRKIF